MYVCMCRESHVAFITFPLYIDTLKPNLLGDNIFAKKTKKQLSFIPPSTYRLLEVVGGLNNVADAL